MKPTLIVLLTAVALVGATGGVAAGGHPSGAGHPAAADGQHPADGAVETERQPPTEQNKPRLPGDDTTTNESNETTTAVSPGQQLAGAVGAQGASLQGELWNRTLTERLTNATTDEERAEVIHDEVETLEAHLDDLESVRANLTGAWADGELSEGEYRASLSEFVVRARTVELRANQTARAAADLPLAVRETRDVNVTHVRLLSERAHDLYQFEGEVGREVANETLTNETALASATGNATRGNLTVDV